MKHLTAIALTLASICVGNAADFEGVVNLTTTTKKGTTNFVYFVQGTHLRTEVPGESGAAAMIGLVDWTRHEMYMLMPQQKMYMTFNLAKALEQAQSKEIAVEETGRTETIAGYEAKDYIVRERKTVTEIWATPDLGRFVLVGDAARSKGKRSAWEHVIADRGLFPLRTIVKNAKGVETSRSEVTLVEKKALEASFFEIPADYQKFGLGALGRMIGGG